MEAHRERYEDTQEWLGVCGPNLLRAFELLGQANLMLAIVEILGGLLPTFYAWEFWGFKIPNGTAFDVT